MNIITSKKLIKKSFLLITASIKVKDNISQDWWLRTSVYTTDNQAFTVRKDGYRDAQNSNEAIGVSPAFRIG